MTTEAIDYNPDPYMTERIRAHLPRADQRWQEGAVLGWVVIDPVTGEWCCRAGTRAEARDLAGRDGAIAKIVGAH